MNRNEIVDATVWTMVSEGLDRVEKAVEKLDGKFDEHVKESAELYARMAVVESKQATMSKIVWGAVSAAGLGFIAALWGLINKGGIS